MSTLNKHTSPTGHKYWFILSGKIINKCSIFFFNIAKLDKFFNIFYLELLDFMRRVIYSECSTRLQSSYYCSILILSYIELSKWAWCGGTLSSRTLLEETGGLCEFEASLANIENSSSPRASSWDPVSELINSFN